jgi:hypothetical protein
MGCSCELNPEETSALRSIFEHVLAHGRSPTLRELQSSLGRSLGDIIRTIDALEKKDRLVRKKGSQEIVSIYPFSLAPTKHQVILQGMTRLFAMCAVDALGAPVMFAKDAKVKSQCEECGQELSAEIKNEGIAFMSHPSMVICSVKAHGFPQAETCCPLINFFCSRKHANDWIAKNLGPENDFRLGTVGERFPTIRESWKRYGEELRFRLPEGHARGSI